MNYRLTTIVTAVLAAVCIFPLLPSHDLAAGELISPEFALEIGLVPMNLLVNYDGSTYAQRTFDPGFYTQLETRVVLKERFWVGGFMKAYSMIRNDAVGFIPYQLLFSFDMGLRYEAVSLGFRHFCFHPMKPYAIDEQEWNSFPTMGTEGAYEEIFLRIEVK